MTVRERLARRGLRPVVVERTVKRPGDLVLDSWALPVRRVTEDETHG